MSYKYVEGVRRARIGKPMLKLLLLCLATYANEKSGECFPSAETLANDIELSVSQTRRLLAELEVEGWLTVVTRGVLAGRNRDPKAPKRRLYLAESMFGNSK
ncbi:MAG: helix-turn-helix domain-containing protein [Chloroflexi bacterium]|nr:helix-turn-helix domain-containing protein [Chloroflexota bacterium]